MGWLRYVYLFPAGICTLWRDPIFSNFSSLNFRSIHTKHANQKQFLHFLKACQFLCFFVFFNLTKYLINTMKCEDDLWNKIEISITSNLFKINNQNKYVTNDFQKQNVLLCLVLGLKLIQCFLLLLVKRTSQKMISYKLIRLMPVNKPSVPPER